MLSALSLNRVIAHLAALLTSRAITPASAALALSMLGISGILGRLITGHLLDRLFAPFVSLAVLLVAAAGIVTIAYATTAAAGILGAFLVGFGSGSEADVVPYLIARYFGRARFSTLYGLSWTAYAIGGGSDGTRLRQSRNLPVLRRAIPCGAARHRSYPATSSACLFRLTFSHQQCELRP
ncbi:MAG: transporter, major facilitator family [Acidobacteriaceae bacterium]|nr:transporter, major facilitator family [Acidobacteriaceae bacterium]